MREYVTDPYHAARRAIAVRLLTSALRYAPAGPVVDLGAGPVPMAHRTTCHGRPVLVIDAATPALRAGLGAGATGAACMDLTVGLALRDGSAAALLMGELIEHLYDPPALLHECRRVLRPDGVLVVTTPNLAGLQDRWRFLRGRSPRQVDALHPYLRLHIRPFTADSLRAVLTDAGFRVTALRSNYVGWQLPTGRWVQSRVAARLAPGLGGSLIACAQRRD
ncbi:MAG: methyltransferase domain-containing protein [Actinocatenispora sp.]